MSEVSSTCVVCNESPADTEGGTLPLCPKCRSLANPRGITIKPVEIPDDSTKLPLLSTPDSDPDPASSAEGIVPRDDVAI